MLNVIVKAGDVSVLTCYYLQPYTIVRYINQFFNMTSITRFGLIFLRCIDIKERFVKLSNYTSETVCLIFICELLYCIFNTLIVIVFLCRCTSFRFLFYLSKNFDSHLHLDNWGASDIS